MDRRIHFVSNVHIASASNGEDREGIGPPMGRTALLRTMWSVGTDHGEAHAVTYHCASISEHGMRL